MRVLVSGGEGGDGGGAQRRFGMEIECDGQGCVHGHGCVHGKATTDIDDKIGKLFYVTLFRNQMNI